MVSDMVAYFCRPEMAQQLRAERLHCLFCPFMAFFFRHKPSSSSVYRYSSSCWASVEAVPQVLRVETQVRDHLLHISQSELPLSILLKSCLQSVS